MNGTQIGLRPSVRRYTPEGDFIEKEYVEGYTVPRESYFDRRQAENARIRGLGDAERFSFAEWVRRHAD